MRWPTLGMVRGGGNQPKWAHPVQRDKRTSRPCGSWLRWEPALRTHGHRHRRPPKRSRSRAGRTPVIQPLVTDGNSTSQTLGFANQLKYVWKDARFDSEVNGVRSSTSDDRFFLIEPGLEFPVGGAPPNPGTSLVIPDPDLDVANYLIRAGYEKNITPRFFWNAGGSCCSRTIPRSRPTLTSSPMSTSSIRMASPGRGRTLPDA